MSVLKTKPPTLYAWGFFIDLTTPNLAVKFVPTIKQGVLMDSLFQKATEAAIVELKKSYLKKVTKKADSFPAPLKQFIEMAMAEKNIQDLGLLYDSFCELAKEFDHKKIQALDNKGTVSVYVLFFQSLDSIIYVKFFNLMASTEIGHDPEVQTDWVFNRLKSFSQALLGRLYINAKEDPEQNGVTISIAMICRVIISLKMQNIDTSRIEKIRPSENGVIPIYTMEHNMDLVRNFILKNPSARYVRDVDGFTGQLSELFMIAQEKSDHRALADFTNELDQVLPHPDLDSQTNWGFTRFSLLFTILKILNIKIVEVNNLNVESPPVWVFTQLRHYPKLILEDFMKMKMGDGAVAKWIRLASGTVLQLHIMNEDPTKVGAIFSNNAFFCYKIEGGQKTPLDIN